MSNFQRIGSISNSHVGRDFELVAKAHFLEAEGLSLSRPFQVTLGVGNAKQGRTFDLGADSPAVLVECKSHRWTIGGNMPSAKVTAWNEAMYRFHLAPREFRKVLFVLRDFHVKRNQSLAEFYARNYSCYIPDRVSIIEFDEPTRNVRVVKAGLVA